MLNNIRKPVFNLSLFFIILTSFLLLFAFLPTNNAFATSLYGNTVKDCPQGSAVPPGKYCGMTFCDNTGIAYSSYGVSAGNCTYHSWNCSGAGSLTCGTRYNDNYWSVSCDKTDAQRNSSGTGATVPPRCIPPPPSGPNCVTDSTGYTLTWNTSNPIPYTTFRVYNGSTLLASPTTGTYRSTNLSIKSYIVKSYGGRENATGLTITCTAPPAPACTSLTANPPSLFVGDTSNLSLTGCTNATTYKWTSTCGTLPSANTSVATTIWTAPGNGPTVCTAWVYACNASGVCSSPYTTPITVNLHDCNGGLQTTSACVATTANTCATGNGTQTAQYTTYNGSTTCNPVNTTQTCTVSSCNVGNVCTNGVCSGQATPTPTPACSGSTPNSCNGQCTNTQTDNNNCGTCGNACTSGQVCSNGACVNSCTAPNTTCNGACVNTQTDNNNCGTCGNVCTSTQACINGSCSLIPGHTYIGFRIGMDAIGSAGDNENSNPSSSNQNPQHTNRNLAVQIFDSNNSQVFAQVGSINYNSGSGVFIGTVDLGANFANGNYTVKVNSDGHLRRLIPGIQNFSSSLTQPIQLPGVSLVVGDIDSNNALNINDYNILLSCVTSPFVANIDNHALCNTNSDYIKLSDLEDNGSVNEFDYNLFLREYAVQNGD